MDIETIAAFGFMAFGLGFFLLVFLLCMQDNDKHYHRVTMEAREFGFNDQDSKKRQHRSAKTD